MAIIREDNGDASADSGTQYTLAVGDLFRGKLDPAGDKDWIQIELTAGTIYDIRLNGVESDQFELFHPSGLSEVYGPYLFSYSTLFRALESGTYLISIGRSNNVDSFDYEISFVEKPISTVSYDEIAAYLKRNLDEKLFFDVETGGILTADITALNSAGQQLARWALEAWTNVTGIKFEFVDDDAHISFDDDELGRGFNYSSTSNGVRVSSHVNVGSDWLITHGSGIDSFTFYAYLHEIGHALGLDHPGPYSGLFPITIDKLFQNDSYQTTVMSYFRQDTDTHVDTSFAYPVTPMIADIIAVQDLYGVPVDINPGDSVYGYGSTVDGYLGELFRLWADEENPFSLIDTGSSAKPAFTDLDGDGDLDLAFGYEEGAIHYYENTGTATEPRYTQRFGADNPLDGLGVDSFNIPTFVDLDRDGDADLVVGNNTVNVGYYENTGTRTEPHFTQRFGADNPLDGVGVNSQTITIFTDLDGDDDPDLTVQNLDGVVHYFENTGNATHPGFTQRTGDTNPLEGITVDPNSVLSFTDLDNDGDPDLVVGNVFNVFYYFENTGNATSPSFTQRTGDANPLENVNAGYFQLPVFVDLDSDSDPDLIITNENRKFVYFKNIGTSTDPSFTATDLLRPVTLTLYDSDGIDTLDLRTDTANQQVDLRPEGISDVYGLVGNLIIARDTLLENFIAGSGDDVVAGNDAANHLQGRDGNDILQGNGGNDVLEGGAGADRLVGGTGTDSVSYFGSDTGVTVNLSDATVTGGHAEGDVIVEVENVRGSAYADILEGDESANGLDGGGGNDELRGNGGDDVLDGGAGADRLVGGAGEDFASFEHSDAAVTVRLHSGVAQGGHAEGDTFAAMETVEYIDSNGGTQQEDVPDIEHLRGSAHDDVLAGDSRANRLEGGAGADRLFGGPGGGDDVLWGGTGEDALFGGSGDDILNGGGDADMLKGGTGEDTASYAHSDAGVEVRLHSGVVLGGDAEGDVLDGIENVRGSAYADILEGDGNANRLDGADGADGLWGNGGDDVLEGGSGDDVLEGGAGADVLDGGAGTDWLSYEGSAAGVRVRLYDGLAQRGHAEGDTITGFENLRGSAHPDRLAGTGRANHLQGGAGNDQMWGGSGDDVLDGGAGADRFYGGPGTDRITYQGSDAGVTVDLEDGTGEGGHAVGDVIVDVENVTGSDYEDTLTGHDGANRLEGGDGDDSLSGQGDHDVLEGGAGADRLDGGEGMDTVVYRNSNEAVTMNLSDGTATGGHAEGDVIADIESIVGSAHSDTLVGNDGVNRLDGQDGDDVLEGGAGADRLDGGAGMDTLVYRNSNEAVTVNLSNGTLMGGHAEGDVMINIENIESSNYDDELIGDSGPNRLDGGDGDDELRGGDGDDQLFGGNGNDLLEGGEGIDRLDGGAGVDTVSYANSKEAMEVHVSHKASKYFYNDEGEPLSNFENVIGSHYHDSLWGSGSANDLYGRGGNDSLYGRAGDDRLFGEEGNDRLTGSEGADQLYGGEGVDTAVYWYSDEAVTVNLMDGTGQGGHAEGDRIVDVENIWGSNHADLLFGDNGPNRLYGFAGNNDVQGNGGDDVLVSGTGADRLDGGSGMDTVSYNRSAEGVTVNLREGIVEGGDAEGDVIVDVENIEGSDHDDMLVGNNEANRLYGSFGNNTLEGGAGADRFIFDFISNNETILDFTDNEDLIDLTVFWNISGFDDLTITSDSDGVTIDLRAYRGGTILLEDFDIANLDASDFIF